MELVAVAQNWIPQQKQWLRIGLLLDTTNLGPQSFCATPKRHRRRSPFADCPFCLVHCFHTQVVKTRRLRPTMRSFFDRRTLRLSGEGFKIWWVFPFECSGGIWHPTLGIHAKQFLEEQPIQQKSHQENPHLWDPYAHIFS